MSIKFGSFQAHRSGYSPRDRLIFGGANPIPSDILLKSFIILRFRKYPLDNQSGFLVYYTMFSKAV